MTNQVNIICEFTQDYLDQKWVDTGVRSNVRMYYRLTLDTPEKRAEWLAITRQLATRGDEVSLSEWSIRHRYGLSEPFISKEHRKLEKPIADDEEAWALLRGMIANKQQIEQMFVAEQAAYTQKRAEHEAETVRLQAERAEREARREAERQAALRIDYIDGVAEEDLYEKIALLVGFTPCRVDQVTGIGATLATETVEDGYIDLPQQAALYVVHDDESDLHFIRTDEDGQLHDTGLEWSNDAPNGYYRKLRPQLQALFPTLGRAYTAPRTISATDEQWAAIKEAANAAKMNVSEYVLKKVLA